METLKAWIFSISLFAREGERAGLKNTVQGEIDQIESCFLQQDR